MYALISIALTGCSDVTESAFVEIDGDYTPTTEEPLSPSDLSDEAGDTLAGAVRSVRVPVVVEAPDWSFVDVRAWREDADGALWTGSSLVYAPVAGGEVTPLLRIPVRPPWRDRDPQDLAKPVVYKVMLRDIDGAGMMGNYIGMSSQELVYVFAAPDTDAGQALGWNIANPDGPDGQTFMPISSGMLLTDDLIAYDEVSLAGNGATAFSETTHILVMNPTLEVQPLAPVYDQPATGTWSFTMNVSPVEESWMDDDILEGGLYGIYAYEDLDGSNRLDNGETISSVACHGGNPVLLSWFDDIDTMDEALVLRQQQLKAGWDVVVRQGDELLLFDPADYSRVPMESTCGMPPAQ